MNNAMRRLSDHSNPAGGCKPYLKVGDALTRLKDTLPELAELANELKNINFAFQNMDNAVDRLPVGKEKRHANTLRIQLFAHKDTYFNADITDLAAKPTFLAACEETINAARPHFKNNLTVLQLFANFFIRLANLLLPNAVKFNLFKPEPTETQTFIREFESKMMSIKMENAPCP